MYTCFSCVMGTVFKLYEYFNYYYLIVIPYLLTISINRSIASVIDNFSNRLVDCFRLIAAVLTYG
jgi:hypothetical protein